MHCTSVYISKVMLIVKQKTIHLSKKQPPTKTTARACSLSISIIEIPKVLLYSHQTPATTTR